MIKRISVLIVFVGVILLLISSGIFDLSNLVNDEQLSIREDSNVVLDIVEVKEIVESVLSPEPLISREQAKPTNLSKNGIFVWTNTHRVFDGLYQLKANALLDDVAKIKLDDMFARQYFAHDSPTGEGASDLAKGARYEFILIGENLASGNFKDDQGLVDAWMDSPGHRANILNKRYSEIGIAVGRGDFEGDEVWLAVQTFGLPLSSCGQIDDNLKDQIDDRIEELEILEGEIKNLYSDIEKASPKRGASYSNKIDTYNSLVNQYNSMFSELDAWIDSYNEQIENFNMCVNAE